MKKPIITILTGIILMGLFGFFKKNRITEKDTKSIILGMILLEEPNSFDLKGTVSELRKKWHLKVDDTDADDKAAILKINDYTIAIANMGVSIPENEVESAAAYNYFCKNGVEETSKHKGHILNDN